MPRAQCAKRAFHLLFIISLAGMIGYVGDPPVAFAAVRPPSPEATQFLGRLSSALAEIADAARPAVVNISTTTTVTMQDNPFSSMFNDPLFRRFFGDQFGQPDQGRKYKSSALGSGVIVSVRGYILTNNHVVQDADEIRVILNDKREFSGKIIGTDPRTDLAVIKINAKDLPVVRFGDSGKLKIGDVVLAIGSPFGLNQTITMGIVSAVGRSNIGLADLEDFIQTDAAINPGNSGGALVNTNGELVGINTAIFSTSGGYIGIGFSIPANMAKAVMDSIIKHGKVSRGWLGVTIQDITSDLAQSLGIKESAGALISGVEKGSPADRAGFRRGDLVVELDKKPVVDATSFRYLVASIAPQTTVAFKIVREGKERTITAILEEHREKIALTTTGYENVLKGVTVQDITPDLRDQLNLPQVLNGVIIAGISSGSPSQEILQPNDVIAEVDRVAVQNVQEYDEVVSKIGARDPVLLFVYRDGETAYVTIRP